MTTKSGIKLEVVGIGPTLYEASELLIGDSDWREMTVPFRTPSQSRGGMIGFRRERTDKYDWFISGTVWIDNVRITEKNG